MAPGSDINRRGSSSTSSVSNPSAVLRTSDSASSDDMNAQYRYAVDKVAAKYARGNSSRDEASSSSCDPARPRHATGTHLQPSPNGVGATAGQTAWKSGYTMAPYHSSVRSNHDWQAWGKISLSIDDLPRDIVVAELGEYFSKYGTIRYINLSEGRGRGRVSAVLIMR